MDAITEIDKAGRVVVPKKLREALHLVPGTRLVLHQEGDFITLQPEAKPRGLYFKSGILVYDAALLPPASSVDWVEEDRNARMQEVLGDWIEL